MFEKFFRQTLFSEVFCLTPVENLCRLRPEEVDMHLRMWHKIGFVALLLGVATLSARASIIKANELDGVNFSYTAVDTNGVLAATFDPASLVTKIDGSIISPTLPSTFAQLTLSPTQLTDDIPGLSGHFTPNLNSTKYGIASLTPPSSPNVVFDYSITFGQVAANGLTMTGTVALDPASATTFTQGSTTYDFSPFQNTFATYTLSLGTQDATGTLIYDTLKSGNGTFSGTGQFDQFVTPVPEPASIGLLLGISGLVTIAARRRRAPDASMPRG
jgi:hypothetical protein